LGGWRGRGGGGGRRRLGSLGMGLGYDGVFFGIMRELI
jgi:hypothetical protein